MEAMNKRLAAAVRPMPLEELELFYSTEYPKLVKILRLLGATFEEAEDAAQKAMADLCPAVQEREDPGPPCHLRTTGRCSLLHQGEAARTRAAAP